MLRRTLAGPAVAAAFVVIAGPWLFAALGWLPPGAREPLSPALATGTLAAALAIGVRDALLPDATWLAYLGTYALMYAESVCVAGGYRRVRAVLGRRRLPESV